MPTPEKNPDVEVNEVTEALAESVAEKPKKKKAAPKVAKAPKVEEDPNAEIVAILKDFSARGFYFDYRFKEDEDGLNLLYVRRIVQGETPIEICFNVTTYDARQFTNTLGRFLRQAIVLARK